MSEKKTSKDSRQKILDAALVEFGDKGFYGTRVDQIAKRAGVSQALIYYNFKSKEEIYKQIFDNFIDSFVQHIEDTYLAQSDDTIPENLREIEFEATLKYALSKRKEFTILLLQGMQKGKGTKQIYSVWDEINKKMRANVLARRGYKADRIDEHSQRAIDYFFFFVPMLMYGVLGEGWIKETGGSIDETNKALTTVYNQLFDAYWK